MALIGCLPLEKYLEGKGVSVHCVHGDIKFYPMAQVEIGVEDPNAHC